MKLSFETFVNAKPEKIWPYYSNLEKWYTWENDLEDIDLEGSFEKGIKGTMKLKEMPPMQFELSSVIENREFVDITSTPMGKVSFGHYITPHGEGAIVKHEVSLDNEKKENLNVLVGIFSDVPFTVYTLKEVVENE